MTDEELKQLDMRVWDKIDLKNAQLQKQLEAYVKGLLDGKDMTIKAIKNYIKETTRRGIDNGNRA